MKKSWIALLDFIKLYTLLQWCLILLFCAGTIFLNYHVGLKKWIQSLPPFERYWANATLYLVHLAGGYALVLLPRNRDAVANKKKLILLILGAVLLFAIRDSLSVVDRWMLTVSSPENAIVNQLTYRYAFRLLLLFVPLMGWWWYTLDYQNQPFYGLLVHKNSLIYYVCLLVLMVPLIAWASTQRDFLSFYPRAALLGNHLPSWRYVVFELFYGADFVGIELFFRGFLVIAAIKYVGIHAIVPMACFYVAIHFGKPVGETISSFFGGTLLGLIAFHTRSIYGGIIVHVGIAWLMEAGGYIGNNYFK